MAVKGAGQVVYFTVWDTANNQGRTGDAANLTLRLEVDGVESTPTNSPSEVNATNRPGRYKITLTDAEMNGNVIDFGGKSSTADTVVVPIQINTDQGSYAALQAAHAATQALIAALNDIAASDVVTAQQAATVEGSITQVMFQRLVLARLTGDTVIANEIVKFLSLDGNTDRITFTMQSDGERTGVLDGS